jgi:methyl-accepting chemotaxis protein
MRAIGNLGLRQKFALIGLIGLVGLAVPTGLWMATSLDRLGQLRLERAGLAPSVTLVHWARALAQHRGLSQADLGGDAAASDTRRKAADVLQAAQAKAHAAFDGLGDAALLERQRSLQLQQQALVDDVAQRRVDAPQAFARHTLLIEAQIQLLDDVVVRSALARHPEVSGNLLQAAALRHLPQLAEWVGQVRGLGMRMLAQGDVDTVERTRVAVLAELARADAAAALRAISRATEADPGLEARLGPAIRQAGTALDDALALVDRGFAATGAADLPKAQWWSRTTTAIDAQVALGDAALAALEADVDATSAARQRNLALGISLLAGLALAAAALGWTLARQTLRSIDAAIVLTDAVAAGNLRMEVAVDVAAGGRDEGARLVAALTAMAAQLRLIVGGVRHNAEQVATASVQIAQGNQDLSARTESQASALQQTAASMEEMRTTIAASADAAGQAAALAREARTVTERGARSVGDLVGAMDQISDGARRMQDIVTTIDDLAFQTNILALNAAVEAARAGPQGRGFAVVAGEVRALAQRSGAAAREIRGLISTSEERVAEGSGKGAEVRRTMAEVVSSIGRVSDLIAEVSAAACEQSRGVAQLGEAVTEMDRVTQQNAALVEESAAAAQSLSQQAQALHGAVETFRT